MPQHLMPLRSHGKHGVAPNADTEPPFEQRGELSPATAAARPRNADGSRSERLTAPTGCG